MHARPDDVLVIWHDMSAHVQEEEQPLLESTVLYAETREHKQLHTWHCGASRRLLALVFAPCSDAA